MKKIVLFFIAILTFSSCSDFLEESSQDETIPTTTTDYSELLTGTL